MERGKYVCIEGINGCGKSTLVRHIFDRLGATEGTKGVIRRFPSDGAIGSIIRDYLSGARELQNPKALLYLYAADGLLQDQGLKSVMGDGVHALVDRHPTLSGRVFQLEHHDQHHVDVVLDTAPLLAPDYLFVMDVPPEVAITRCAGRAKYSDVVFGGLSADVLDQFRGRYAALTKTARAMGWAKHAYMINGMLPVEDLVDTVIETAWLR